MEEKDENYKEINIYQDLTDGLQNAVFQEDKYKEVKDYAKEKLIEFQLENKTKLPIMFMHKVPKFERMESLPNGQLQAKKCLDFLDELNEGLLEIWNK
ncbi:hypothetical protein [Hwangdonia seohaensis]|uniref:Uncharacterized protein n=1 Tax=Hwangdonia seohaensis TaxID=1240727 RepID=A0ABW3RCP8_9FLAO|nr:hypothetical protein [Hwangdonia seohaensis]